MKFVSSLPALAIALCATAATAEVTSMQRAACTPDVFRLCSSDVPNVGKITACLRRERTSLSPSCRSVMDEADKPAARVATRSLVQRSEWCRFDRAETASKSLWRDWCGDASWTD